MHLTVENSGKGARETHSLPARSITTAFHDTGRHEEGSMLKQAIAAGALVISVIDPTLAEQPQRPVCVDFEPPLVLGTQYGAPAGNVPGDVIIPTPIPVAVDSFKFSGPGGTFGVALVNSAPFPFGSGQSMRTNNINLLFDFTKLGFTPLEVRFGFLDLGGFENISVNGTVIFAGELSSAPSPIGGANFAVTTTPVTGGKRGEATLLGPVMTLKVGGQEFWLDHVCASPQRGSPEK